MKKKLSLIPDEHIENIIYVIRGQKVMLDRDLANLYGVLTKALLQAVKRNIKRFPEDFMFKLTWEEVNALRSQIVTLKKNDTSKRGKHIKYLPYAFTEHGVVMLANVLRSEHAVLMSIEVVRAFIKLRQILVAQKEFSKEITELKSFVLRHSQKTDQEFRRVWRAIEKLSTPMRPQSRIGFRLE